MSTLEPAEVVILERAFEMAGGYVLDFSNPSLARFVAEATGTNIELPLYATYGTSKANRLRTFWSHEDDATVAAMLDALNAYGIAKGRIAPPDAEAVSAVVTRLRAPAALPDSDVFTAAPAECTIRALADEVQAAITANRHGAALDRVHTFVTAYLRTVCEARGIAVERDKPLHSLMGEYIKILRTNGELRSTMSERILKATISTLESFNDVRNHQSLAHDNEIITGPEATYLVSHVAILIRLLSELERGR